MKYHTQKGIVLTSIGGQLVLVAAASLHDRVSYVVSINDTTAFCWEKLSQSWLTKDELIDLVLGEFDVNDEETVRTEISELVQQLYEKGYIVAEKELA